MHDLFRLGGILVPAVLVVAAAGSAQAAGVGAGTIIESRAEATFEADKVVRTAISNISTLRVEEVLDVTLASRDSGPVPGDGATAVLTFELTNTGNGPERFSVTANAAVSGNDFESAIAALAVDTNGNALYDEGIDQILAAPAMTDPLVPDLPVTLFVIAAIPDSAADGAQSAIELAALAATGTGSPGTIFVGAGQEGSDAVVGAGMGRALATGRISAKSGAVELMKSASVTDPLGGTSAFPGATIRYSIAATVSGSEPVQNLVVTDRVPAGTSYVPGTLTLDGIPLTDAPGDDAGEADTAAIAVALGTAAGGTSSTITFDVRIEK